MDAQYSTIKPGSLSDRIVTRMRRVMFQRFLELTSVQPTQTILDVGATSDERHGASNYLEAWYPYKHAITACGIDNASSLMQKYPGIQYVRTDGLALPFADRHFDVVHSSAVLEHVGSNAQQEIFISELLRVARHAVFLTTPNRWYPVEFHTTFPLLHWLPPASFRRILTALGHRDLALEQNLNLLGARDLVRMCRNLRLRNFVLTNVRLLGWPSNLLLTIRPDN